MAATTTQGPLDTEFTAPLVQSRAKGGWTYVQMPGSAEYFGTRGWSGSGDASTGTRSRARSWLSGTARTSCR